MSALDRLLGLEVAVDDLVPVAVLNRADDLLEEAARLVLGHLVQAGERKVRD